MIFYKFLRNEKSYWKNTWNTLPLFSKTLNSSVKQQLNNNSLAEIRKKSSDTKSLHLLGSAAQTMGRI